MPSIDGSGKVKEKSCRVFQLFQVRQTAYLRHPLTHSQALPTRFPFRVNIVEQDCKDVVDFFFRPVEELTCQLFGSVFICSEENCVQSFTNF